MRTALLCVSVTLSCVVASCSRDKPGDSQRTFTSPEAAVEALRTAVAKGDLGEVTSIFGADSKDLIDTSDPVTARNRQVFTTAMDEAWRLVDDGPRKTLVVGNEAWPFPVPLIQDDGAWRFDTAAGREEVIARRVGRNELAAIRISRAYVAAQREYARSAHDGKPPGAYAVKFRSDPGTQNGLYWPAERGEGRSPLGDLVAEAADAGVDTTRREPAPFHGYYFRILRGQGASAEGGAKDYVRDGQMTGGFALLAWPAHYDTTGIMTFVINQDGVVHEKDLGRDTAAAAGKLRLYDPDDSWSAVN